MKKLILLLLFTTLSQAQEMATLHFYVSTELTTGGEILMPIHVLGTELLGFGFSGAWEVKEIVPGHINEYDLKQPITNKENEEWCSLYATASYGYLWKFLIKYKAGLGVYNQKYTFDDSYTKINKVVYKPLLGVGAMLQITKDVGLEIGYDTFNRGTIGFTAIF